MSLFDLQPLTIEQVRANQLANSEGGTIRKISATGKVRTTRHKPWWMLLGKGPEGKTCKSCQFLKANGYTRQVYYKCGRQSITRGEGTDIRLKDAACRLFTERTT